MSEVDKTLALFSMFEFRVTFEDLQHVEGCQSIHQVFWWFLKADHLTAVKPAVLHLLRLGN